MLKRIHTQVESSAKVRSRLFLVCPECCMESHVHRHFDGHNYFLTALGAVFSMDDFRHTEQVHDAIMRNEVQEICIIHSDSCRISARASTPEQAPVIRAEKVLASICEGNPRTLAHAADHSEKGYQLARLNIMRQGLELLDLPYIGAKIEEGELALSGYVYRSGEDRFEATATSF